MVMKKSFSSKQQFFFNLAFFFIILHNWVLYSPLRKQAYSDILKILQPKKEIFQIKNSDIFHTSAQNIDCGYLDRTARRGGSNEYPQSMFS